MKKICWLLIAICVNPISPAFGQTVQILFASNSPQQSYAAGILEKTLQEKGYNVKRSSAKYIIRFVVNAKQLEPEAYSIVWQGKNVLINGGDERGLIYGSLSLAEDLRNGMLLKNIKPKKENPHVPLLQRILRSQRMHQLIPVNNFNLLLCNSAGIILWR